MKNGGLYFSIVLAGALSAFACGNSDDGKQGGTGGSSGTDGSGGASTSGGASSGGSATASGGSAAGMAGATSSGSIRLDSVEPLGGGLHVMWTSSGASCDKIELWRKKDAGEYALAYTLTAAADSQHDAQVMSPGMYCYKVRCVKGSSYTESNEKCASP